MEIIGQQKIWTFRPGGTQAVEATCASVRKSKGILVNDYMELATKIAELQFNNRDFVLLFRGQRGDFRSSANMTSIKPNIFRGSAADKVPSTIALRARFRKLAQAEEALVERYETNSEADERRMKRQQILRWSILQHYEICKTPLVDVTHSLRIAASFASDGATGEAHIFVLGVPHISGAVTASAEAGLQIVRLASVCPPVAVRPHIQEGYLLGEYPDVASIGQKAHYANYEFDFGRRLIAKFRFEPDEFWERSGSFPQVPRKALYPNAKSDPFCMVADAIKSDIA